MKPKYAILAIAFLTSVITGVLLPHSAFAASYGDDYLQTTPTLYAGLSGQSYGIDLGMDWSSILKGTYTKYSVSGSCSSQAITDLDTAINTGGVVIREHNANMMNNVWGYTSSWAGTTGTIGDSAEITWEATVGTQAQGNSLPGLNFYNYDQYGESGVGLPNTAGGSEADDAVILQDPAHPGTLILKCFTNNLGQMASTATGATTGSYWNNAGGWTRLFFSYGFPVNYPSGYAGVNAPDHYTPPVPPQLPSFGYTIDKNLNLNVNYLRNLDIPSDVNNGYQWTYNLYNSDSTYAKGTLLNNNTLGFIIPYTYTLPSQGYYVLDINLSVTPPAAPRTDIGTVEFQLNADGTMKVGSTTLDNCNSSGVCTTKVDCNVYTDIFQRANCMMQQQFSLGVINPSITAFKNILTSFVVPATPSCSLSIPNVTLAGGFVFSMSSFSSSMCDNSTSIMQHFPIVPILINGFLALAILYLIIRMINRLTDNRETNMIEGVSG